MILFYLWKLVSLNKSDCRQKEITGSAHRALHVAIQGCVSNKPGKERKMSQKFWLVKSRKILLQSKTPNNEKRVSRTGSDVI